MDTVYFATMQYNVVMPSEERKGVQYENIASQEYY